MQKKGCQGNRGRPILILYGKKLVYQFPSFGSSINCIAQSPVVDVVGIGIII